MSEIRDSLLTQLTTNLAGSSVAVATELPFTSGGELLYIKNMKKLYVDETTVEQDTLYEVLDRNNIVQNTNVVTAYLVVDAKNQLADINSVISSILSAKSVIARTVSSESDYILEYNLDKMIYTFEFRFITV